MRVQINDAQIHLCFRYAPSEATRLWHKIRNERVRFRSHRAFIAWCRTHAGNEQVYLNPRHP